MKNIIALASEERTATNDSGILSNSTRKGAIVIIDVTDDPAAASVTFKVQGRDLASGKWYDIITSAAIAAVGTTVLKIYPGLTAAANVVVSDVLPSQFRVLATHTDADAITYSVGVNLLP